METNVFLLSTPEKIGIYLTLGLCGLLVMLLALHAQRKFSRASRALGTLNTLNKEWEEAQTKFFEAEAQAQDHVGALSLAQHSATPEAPSAEIGFDLKNQVTSMAKRGAATAAIARSANLTEAEVDVVLGMARLDAERKK